MSVKKNNSQKRGIFAIEGEWESDLRGGLSFRPILELLHNINKSPFVHRDAATKEELFYYLDKWLQKRYAAYPVLSLGFHGEEESILIGDGRLTNCRVTLNELMNHLEGRCNKRILYIGSCSTMQIDERRLQTFLRTTGALAICGYRVDVDMLRSAAFELLLFQTLLENTSTLHGANAMKRRIESEERTLCRELGFRMVVRKNK